MTSFKDFERKWREFKQGLREAENSHVYHLANYEDSFYMYADVVSLLQLNVFDSAVDAERRLKDYAVNRKKVSAVRKYLDQHGESPPAEVPAEFCAGKTH